MVEWLLELDKNVLLFINGLHNPFFDQLMVLLSGKFIWIPLYLLLIYLGAKEYGWKSLLLIGLCIVAVVLSDQLTSSIMKPFFERLRPSREPSLEGVIHLVNGYRGGKFGFASSHAANTFAVATFFAIGLGSQYKFLKWLFLWAALVSLSRVYLGVHYPGDVIVGGLIGAGFGWVLLVVFHRTIVHPQKSST